MPKQKWDIENANALGALITTTNDSLFRIHRLRDPMTNPDVSMLNEISTTAGVMRPWKKHMHKSK